MRSVLVPLDRTEASEKALPFLNQVCAKNDGIALFSVVKLAEPIRTGGVRGTTLPEAELGVLVPELPVFAENEEKTSSSQVGEAKDYLERLAGPLREAGFIVQTRVSVDDRPEEAIIRFARGLKPTFITLSRSTRLQPAERLFGSVTTRVVESNVAPIMLVPSNS